VAASEYPIHEVIIGGESGPNARPCHVEWIEDILRQCDDAGIPAFLKQLGSNPYLLDPCTAESIYIGRGSGGIKHPKGGDPAEWPTWLQSRAYAAKK
jgi:hypothetical protein